MNAVSATEKVGTIVALLLSSEFTQGSFCDETCVTLDFERLSDTRDEGEDVNDKDGLVTVGFSEPTI